MSGVAANLGGSGLIKSPDKGSFVLADLIRRAYDISVVKP